MTPNVEDIIEVGPGIGRSRTPVYPEGMVSEGWSETEWRNFGSVEEGRYYGGVWYGSPGTATISSIPSDQFVCIRRGHVRFTDQNGNSRDFTEGAAFLMPHGFSGQWELTTEVEIVYIALGPFGEAVPR